MVKLFSPKLSSSLFFGTGRRMGSFAFESSKASKLPSLTAHSRISKPDLLAKIQREIRELNVTENLNVYTAVYKIISKTASRGRKGHYSLILLNSRDNTISIENYGVRQFTVAAQDYLDLERKHFDDKRINIVLVNTEDIKKLELSYPNYFMDTKILVQSLSLIMMGKFFEI
jgi:hypothetical protein